MSKNGKNKPRKIADPLTGAQLAAQALQAHGVTRVFALCGDHVNALFHAIDRQGIEIIGTRHESAAVQMADGWARATGRPGVAVVTGGPGHTNAITGAAVAQGAQSPVVIISGQATKKLRERGGNQSLHQASLMRPLTKWAIEAESAEGVGELISRALTLASAGTPGAVSVSIPVDVATDIASSAAPVPEIPMHPKSRTPTGTVSPAIAHAAKLLAAAKRPIAVIGGNAWRHGQPATIARTLRKLGIPAFTNGQSRGVVPDDGKHCFGYANPLFNTTFRAASEADLILLVGSTLDYSFGSGRNRVANPAAHIVQVHQDQSQIGIGGTPHAAVAGDHAAVLLALQSATRPQSSARWKAWRRKLQQQHKSKEVYWQQFRRNRDSKSGGIHPAALCEALQKYWSPDTTLVFDVGDFTNWPKAWFPALSPARFMDGGALGNLGGAVPLAIGAQVAAGRSPVWGFIGDGGFGFHGWELSVAVEKALPVKIIVGNDNCWGTEKRLQHADFGRDIACELPAIRYDEFARLLGATAFRATTGAELTHVVDRFMKSRGPSLLQVDLVSQAGRPFQVPGKRA